MQKKREIPREGTAWDSFDKHGGKKAKADWGALGVQIK